MMATNQDLELHLGYKAASELGESPKDVPGRKEGVFQDSPGPGADDDLCCEGPDTTMLFRVGRATEGLCSPPDSISTPKSTKFQVFPSPEHSVLDGGQAEAEEPLLAEEAKTSICTGDPDYVLLLNEMNCPEDGELRSRSAFLGGLLLAPTCQELEERTTSTVSTASLNGRALSAEKSNPGQEINSFTVLWPSVEEQWPCGAPSPYQASEAYFSLLCSSSLKQGAPSNVLCPPLERSPASVALCPSVVEKVPSKEVCEFQEENAFSPTLWPHFKEQTNSPAPCAPLEGRVPSVMTLPCVDETVAFSPLVPSQKQSVLTGTLCPDLEGDLSQAVTCSPLEQSLSLVATDYFVEGSVETLKAQLGETNQNSKSSGDDDSGTGQRPNAQQGVTEETSSICLEDEEAEHLVCPICTEQYDADRCRQAMLNCRHTVCDSCVRAIMDQSGQADIGRVKCPLCRQKTPMMKWEIRKLQEEMLERDCSPRQAVYAAPVVVQMRPGPCGALEYNFKQRFQTSRMFSCIPCLRYPLCFIERLEALERHSRCCYLFVLALLYCVEKLSFLVPFLPILMLVLIIVLDK